MSTGLLSIKHKKKDGSPQTEAEKQKKQREKRLALRYFNKGNMYIPQEVRRLANSELFIPL